MGQERSLSDVLQDILRNLQDIVRSEIRLAKVELREEGRRAVASGLWIAGGAVVGMSAWLFALWALAYALAERMPMWAATLVIAIALAATAALLIMGGIHRLRRLQPIPERTVESVKENIEWMKQPTK